MSQLYNLTTEKILKHREARKDAGMVGCQDGSDVPFGSLRGISWKMDTKGRYADHPEFDPNDPHCFCHDCRRTFDPEGTHDLKLVGMGNQGALRVYADLIRPFLPMRSNGGGIDPPAELPPMRLQRPLPLSPPQDLPWILPVPRERNLLAETFAQRLKADLSVLRADLQAKLIVTMDSSRRATGMPEEERARFLESLGDKETTLWAKLNAIDLLLKG